MQTQGSSDQLKVTGLVTPESGLEPRRLGALGAPAPGQNRAETAQHPNHRVTQARAPPPAAATGAPAPPRPGLEGKGREREQEEPRAWMRAPSPAWHPELAGTARPRASWAARSLALVPVPRAAQRGAGAARAPREGEGPSAGQRARGSRGAVAAAAAAAASVARAGAARCRASRGDVSSGRGSAGRRGGAAGPRAGRVGGERRGARPGCRAGRPGRSPRPAQPCSPAP